MSSGLIVGSFESEWERDPSCGRVDVIDTADVLARITVGPKSLHDVPRTIPTLHHDHWITSLTER